MTESGGSHLANTGAWALAPATALVVLLLLGGRPIDAFGAPQDARPGKAPDYAEPYRPQYHFTPAANWMNDPNGLVYFDGEYHLFYQYNPFGDVWGHMSWGHAVSTDLVHWKHLPVALLEENGVMIFSGSAVVDEKNTSGFGKGGVPPLVAIYTGYRPADNNQSQHIAYSTDRGRTWTKYAGNPVIDIGSTEFRDPKVFWYEPAKRWIMALALAAEHKIRFYGSPDLKQWTHLSDFGPAGAVGGVWECPDLFELPVDGSPGQKKWVLVVNLNPGAYAGGSGAQYFLGSFDGKQFRSDDEASRTRWIDYGKDFYAVVSWANIPPKDGRRLWIGWMNNWEYGQLIPTSPWRSAQSIPREARLRRYADGVRLVQSPVREMRRLRGARTSVANVAIPAVAAVAEGRDPLAGRQISGTTLEILATFDVGAASEVGLKVRKGAGEETVVGYDVKAGELFVDRSRSGAVGFDKRFPGRHAGPMALERNRVTLHLFVDRSSVEVFGNDGYTQITEQIFPSAGSDGVEVYAKGGTARLISLEAWPLRSTWTASGAGRR